MPLHESGEDYLEAILVLHEQKGNVRSIDVASTWATPKPSVSRAMSILRSSGYITMERDGRILLTEAGKTAAESVYERHRFLTKWLIQLGVTPEVAAGGRLPASSTTSARRPSPAETARGGRGELTLRTEKDAADGVPACRVSPC